MLIESLRQDLAALFDEIEKNKSTMEEYFPSTVPNAADTTASATHQDSYMLPAAVSSSSEEKTSKPQSEPKKNSTDIKEKLSYEEERYNALEKYGVRQIYKVDKLINGETWFIVDSLNGSTQSVPQSEAEIYYTEILKHAVPKKD